MLRIGTRGSQLALWQARAVAALLTASGDVECRIVTIKTAGDRLQDQSLSAIGGKGLFVKEIEEALLGGEIDLAVHSSKDMPAVLAEGLDIAAVLPREDPLDAIVLPTMLPTVLPAMPLTVPPTVQPTVAPGMASSTTGAMNRSLESVNDVVAVLGPAPIIGTGSVRRIAQLTRLIPGARFTPIRGNLDTRLRKIDAGEYHALVLAAAGLRRLGFSARISLTLPVATCVPAPGQGIVAVEIRQRDEQVRRMVTRIDDAGAASALTAERALVAALGGGCQTPIGALATPDGEALDLVAVVVSLDGARSVRSHVRGNARDAAALGAEAAARLLRDGAGEILAEAQRTPPMAGGA